MDWEYRAVEWTSHDPLYDNVFMDRRAKLVGEGWEEHVRAHWGELTGGACIMRRPKDEPRMWTEGEITDLMDEVHRRRAMRFEEATRPAGMTVGKYTGGFVNIFGYEEETNG